ncbi:hypothetical protein PR202_ga12198 [Eleusine coracana subsp. coracana]|uniref:Uncharacterized protein n=1 Tax=Eleusine coracana subsp. coracana TaxID=191504 RepID=A0AAV5CBD4_ELECO|nr:hypothetical protein PR202_ga12198 [Eleusine coracana subsp. coracana]
MATFSLTFALSAPLFDSQVVLARGLYPAPARGRPPVVCRRIRPLPCGRPSFFLQGPRLAGPRLPLAGLRRQPLRHHNTPPPPGRHHLPHARRLLAHLLVWNVRGDAGFWKSNAEAGPVVRAVPFACSHNSSFAWPLLVLRAAGHRNLGCILFLCSEEESLDSFGTWQ